MKRCSTIIGLIAVLAGAALATSASASVVMYDVGFDDTNVFTTSTSGYAGSSATAIGRWGDFVPTDPTNGPSISDTVAYSGSQSMRVIRSGGYPSARVDFTNTAEQLLASFWVYREHDGSAALIQIDNNSNYSTPNLGATTYIQPNGIIKIRSNSSWTATSYFVPTGHWHQVKVELDYSIGTYGQMDLSVTPQGSNSTQVISLAMNDEAPVNVNSFRVAPQGTDGNVMYYDDFYMESIPEPSSLALLGLFAAIGLWRRHRRNA